MPSSQRPSSGHRSSSEYEPRHHHRHHHRSGSGHEKILVSSYPLQRRPSVNEAMPPLRRGSSFTQAPAMKQLQMYNGAGIGPVATTRQQPFSNLVSLSVPHYEGWTIRKCQDVSGGQVASWENVKLMAMGLDQPGLLEVVNRQARDGRGSVSLDYDALDDEDQRRHIDDLVHEKIATERSPNVEWTKACIGVSWAPTRPNSSDIECKAVKLVLKRQVRLGQYQEYENSLQTWPNDRVGRPVAASQSQVYRRESADGYGSLPNDFKTRPRAPYAPAPPSASRVSTSASAKPTPQFQERNSPLGTTGVPLNSAGRHDSPQFDGFMPSKGLPGPPPGPPPRATPPTEANGGIPERERRPYGREGRQTHAERQVQEDVEKRSSQGHIRRASDQPGRSRPIITGKATSHPRHDDSAVYDSNDSDDNPRQRRRSVPESQHMKPPPTPPPVYSAPNGSMLGHTGRSSAGSALEDNAEAESQRRRYSDDYPDVRSQAGQVNSGHGGVAMYYAIQPTDRRKAERSVSFIEGFEVPWPVAPAPIRPYAMPAEWERERRRSSIEYKDGGSHRRRGD